MGSSRLSEQISHIADADRVCENVLFILSQR